MEPSSVDHCATDAYVCLAGDIIIIIIIIIIGSKDPRVKNKVKNGFWS